MSEANESYSMTPIGSFSYIHTIFSYFSYTRTTSGRPRCKPSLSYCCFGRSVSTQRKFTPGTQIHTQRAAPGGQRSNVSFGSPGSMGGSSDNEKKIQPRQCQASSPSNEKRIEQGKPQLRYRPDQVPRQQAKAHELHGISDHNDGNSDEERDVFVS